MSSPVHALKVVDDDATVSFRMRCCVLLPCLESERFVVHGTGTADRSTTVVAISISIAATTATATNTSNINNISSVNYQTAVQSLVHLKLSGFMQEYCPALEMS